MLLPNSLARWINGLVPKFIHVPADDTPTVIGALEPSKYTLY